MTRTGVTNRATPALVEGLSARLAAAPHLCHIMSGSAAPLEWVASLCLAAVPSHTVILMAHTIAPKMEAKIGAAATQTAAQPNERRGRCNGGADAHGARPRQILYLVKGSLEGNFRASGFGGVELAESYLSRGV